MELAFGAQGLWFEFHPNLYFCHAFICFFVTNFVRKLGAGPGLAKEPLILFNVKKRDFMSNRLSVINK